MLLQRNAVPVDSTTTLRDGIPKNHILPVCSDCLFRFLAGLVVDRLLGATAGGSYCPRREGQIPNHQRTQKLAMMPFKSLYNITPGRASSIRRADCMGECFAPAKVIVAREVRLAFPGCCFIQRLYFPTSSSRSWYCRLACWPVPAQPEAR